MAKHLESGKQGEQRAAGFLREQGYTLLAVNWRHRYWEVDIIALDREVLCFIEVKTRKNTLFGEAATFVDEKKQHNLLQAAEAYLALYQHDGDIRFDIVSVYSEANKIELIKDAFWSS